MHICVTRPQWVKDDMGSQPSYLYNVKPYFILKSIFKNILLVPILQDDFSLHMLYNVICAEMYKQNWIAKQKLWVQLGILTRNTIFILLDSGGRFKNAYELLTLRALKISMFHKRFTFQCMGKIFCVEFQRYPLKFHTKYLTHTLKDTIFIQHWNFKSS